MSDSDESKPADTAKLLRSLQDVKLYPHEIHRFELLETHISWVLLTGPYAYKIKKPIAYGFINTSTLARRKRCCDEELRLNRRAAPELYLAVLPIYGTPGKPTFEPSGSSPLEFAVKIRQFPHGDLLNAIAERNELAQEHVRTIAKQVANLHRRAERAGADSRFGSPEETRKWARENFEEIDKLLADGDSTRDQLGTLADWSETQYRRRSAFMTSRKRDGFVRECHGDLRLSNMVLLEEEVRLFDCIDFNAALRWIDVMNDIAFTLVDLRFYGGRPLAQRFLHDYLEQTGDYGGVPLLPYYCVYRALVRAKVTLLKSGQAAEAEKAKARQTYQRYLDAADHDRQRKRPMLVILHGLSGSGKSTVAEPLALQTDSIRLRSDLERKRLRGLDPHAATHSNPGRGIYDEASSRATYQRLRECAASVLSGGYTAMVDAAFLKRRQRQAFRHLAEEMEIPFAILDIHAPEPILRQRITARQRRGDDPSEADTSVLDLQLEKQDPLTPEEQSSAIRVDTSKKVEPSSILHSLQERND